MVEADQNVIEPKEESPEDLAARAALPAAALQLQGRKGDYFEGPEADSMENLIG